MQHYDQYTPPRKRKTKAKYNFTDPLSFDYKHEMINGGIQRVCLV